MGVVASDGIVLKKNGSVLVNAIIIQFLNGHGHRQFTGHFCQFSLDINPLLHFVSCT